MVLMVTFPLCAGVYVHFKKAYLAYFVAYIAHFRLLVIGDISRKICANIWEAHMWFISQVKRFRLWCISQARISRNCLWCISQSRQASVWKFSHIRHDLLVIVFTIAGLFVGGVWGVWGWCVVQCGEGGVLLGMWCVWRKVPLWRFVSEKVLLESRWYFFCAVTVPLHFETCELN